MRAWNGEGNLLDLLKADPDVSKALPAAKLEAMFDLGYHLKQVDTIFKRSSAVSRQAASSCERKKTVFACDFPRIQSRFFG